MKTTRSLLTLSLSALSLLNGSYARLLLAALLALAAGPAFADVLIPTAPYRRPAQLKPTLQPTSQTHLEATQRALKIAFDALLDAGTPHNTVVYGGHLARTREEIAAAQATTEAALAFVKAHPEANPLANGTAADTLPPLPKLIQRRADDFGQLPSSSPTETSPPSTASRSVSLTKPPSLSPNEALALTGELLANDLRELAGDALAVALDAITNKPAPLPPGLVQTGPDKPYPVLGELGGERAKIIAAIGRAGAALSDAFAYRSQARITTSGVNDTGIIPLQPAGTAVRADPKHGPTTRTYLIVARADLDRFIAGLTDSPYAPAVRASLALASAELKEAFAWLDAHPEAEPLGTGPAPNDAQPSLRAPEHLPRNEANRRGSAGQSPDSYVRYKLESNKVGDLGRIGGSLMNSGTAVASYRGPVLGDLGGHRLKLVQHIYQAMIEMQVGIDNARNAP